MSAQKCAMNWAKVSPKCGVNSPVLKRYPEPVAHGPEAPQPMARRLRGRHTRTDTVNTVRQREIPFLSSAESGIRALTIKSMWNYHNFTFVNDFRSEIGEIPAF